MDLFFFRKIMINIMVKNKKKETDLFILEGKRLINDAIRCNLKIEYIFFSLKESLKDIEQLNSLVETGQTKLIKVTYKNLQIFSSLVTSPGLVAVLKKPNYNDFENDTAILNDNLPLILICDNIRDPGNLGTVIRTAAGAGINKILLTEGCVDIWNNKVIKTAAGAHFRIPLFQQIPWNDLELKLPKNFNLFIADSKEEPMEQLKSLVYYQVDFFKKNDSEQTPNVLIIGNEAFGLSKESYKFALKYSGKRLRIPLYVKTDSLNCATASAIIIYEIRKQFNNL